MEVAGAGCILGKALAAVRCLRGVGRCKSPRGSGAVTVACEVGKSLAKRDSRWVHVLGG